MGLANSEMTPGLRWGHTGCRQYTISGVFTDHVFRRRKSQDGL